MHRGAVATGVVISRSQSRPTNPPQRTKPHRLVNGNNKSIQSFRATRASTQLPSNLDDLSDDELSPSKRHTKRRRETRDEEYNDEYSVGERGEYSGEAEEEEMEVDMLQPKRIRLRHRTTVNPHYSSSLRLPGSPSGRVSSISTSAISSTSNGYRRQRPHTINIGDSAEDHQAQEELPGLLWGSLLQRQYGHSSAGHHEVMRKATYYMQAMILTGSGGRYSTPWPEKNPSWANGVIAEVWIYCKVLIQGGTTTRGDIDVQPKDFEARRLLDCVGSFRSHAMSKVRIIVASEYKFHRATQPQVLVAQLLSHDAFLLKNYHDGKDPKTRGRRKFLADVILCAIIEVFFRDRHLSLGSLSVTRDLFTPLRPATVWFIATLVFNAIGEWEGGQKRTINFEGPKVEDTYDRIKKSWTSMSGERQKLTIYYLNEKVLASKPGSEDAGATADTSSLWDNRVDDLLESDKETTTPDSDASSLHQPSAQQAATSAYTTPPSSDPPRPGDTDEGSSWRSANYAVVYWELHRQESYTYTMEWNEFRGQEFDPRHTMWYRVAEDAESEWPLTNDDEYAKFLKRTQEAGNRVFIRLEDDDNGV